jgi:hypothetical protein
MTLRQAIDGVRHRSGQQGQRSAHESGWKQQTDKTHRKQCERRADRSREIHRDPVVEERLRPQRECTDAALGEGKGQHRTSGRETIGDHGSEDRAKTQPGEKRTDHQRRRHGIGTREHAQHPLPGHLTEQSGEAGAKEGEEEP